MKIELVNDNQIRVTLNREDLADRHIKLSELAYGGEKAKELFRDMMQQANYEFGFEANDIPLMIEAIPLSAESIVLIVTKVEDPEELDTRFSNFAPGIQGGASSTEKVSESIKSFTEGATDVLDFLKKLRDKAMEGVLAEKSKVISDTREVVDDKPAEAEDQGKSESFVRIFSFDKLDDVIRFAHVLKGCELGVNTLYQLEGDGFYLELMSDNESPELINKVCNIASEYGRPEEHSSASQAYLGEHCEVVIADKALQVLAGI